MIESYIVIDRFHTPLYPYTYTHTLIPISLSTNRILCNSTRDDSGQS